MKLAAFLLMTVAAWAQDATSKDATSKDATFEVATVKPSPAVRDGYSINNNPGRFRATNATLAQLIRYAIPAQSFQIVGGPAWIHDARFDIAGSNGESDADVKNQAERIARIRSRLRHLLEDRFQLQLREEQRELPVYALEIEKSGIRMKPAEPVGNVSTNGGAAGSTLQGKGLTMPRLCEILSGIVERPVNDETGLPGAFDLELKYSQNDASTDNASPNNAAAEASLALPSLFTALKEQTGLRLTSRKGTAPVWIVVRAEKPGEN